MQDQGQGCGGQQRPVVVGRVVVVVLIRHCAQEGAACTRPNDLGHRPAAARVSAGDAEAAPGSGAVARHRPGQERMVAAPSVGCAPAAAVPSRFLDLGGAR